MQDQLTDHLDQQLQSTSLENFSDYLKNLQQLPSLQDFFSVYIAKHDLKISQIIKNSGISQSYAHEILNGTKPHPSRDYLLALCLGAHMDLKTTQHALRTAQLGELYAKVPRDAAIAGDVLADEVKAGEVAGYEKEWNINGEKVTLGVEKR